MISSLSVQSAAMQQMSGGMRPSPPPEGGMEANPDTQPIGDVEGSGGGQGPEGSGPPPGGGQGSGPPPGGGQGGPQGGGPSGGADAESVLLSLFETVDAEETDETTDLLSMLTENAQNAYDTTQSLFAA